MTLIAVTLLLALFLTTSALASSNPSRDRMAHRLDRGLAGSPMAHTGRQLEAAGWKYRVHPAFIAAIAATESSLGRAACNNNRYNAFGLSSCGNQWRVPLFRSWAHVYDFMGRFLHERWPYAKSPWDFHGYALCSECWGSKVAWFMRSLFGVEPDVRYGR